MCPLHRRQNVPPHNKNLFQVKNLITPRGPPPAGLPLRRQPRRNRPCPLGRRSPPRSRNTYPTPQPPPLKGRGRRGGPRTIEQSTTTSKRTRPPHSTPPTQTRSPQTRKGLGRKARPRASPNVTADPGRRACFSLLAPRMLADWLVSAGSWSSGSLRGGSSGTLRVPSSPPYTRAAAKTPPRACRKAPRTAERPRPGTRAQDAPERPPRMAPARSGWGARDSPHTERGPVRRLDAPDGPSQPASHERGFANRIASRPRPSRGRTRVYPYVSSPRRATRTVWVDMHRSLDMRRTDSGTQSSPPPTRHRCAYTTFQAGVRRLSPRNFSGRRPTDMMMLQSQGSRTFDPLPNPAR